MNNIILIGMPGSGKSTIGVILAKTLAMHFVDTDLLIQAREQRDLQSIVDQEGYLRLRQIEEEVILASVFTSAVVATGGSAVHSEAAIRHLGVGGTIVYLKPGVKDLLQRITNMSTRGIAKPAGQTFEELFAERDVLYRRYGQVVIDCAAKKHEQVAAEVIAGVRAFASVNTAGPR